MAAPSEKYKQTKFKLILVYLYSYVGVGDNIMSSSFQIDKDY